jgi:hypothetical protein
MFSQLFEVSLYVLGFFFCSSWIFAFPLATIITLFRTVLPWTTDVEETFFRWMLLRVWSQIWAIVFILGSGLELLIYLVWLFPRGARNTKIYSFPILRAYLATFNAIAQILGKVVGLGELGLEGQQVT